MMPTKQFAFERGGPKHLKLSWGAFSKDLAIDFETAQLGRCTIREFKAGQEFRLPDGSRLYVRLTRKGLDVRRNGKPLPDSSSDPAVTLRHAYGVTLFVGAGNLLLGALSLLNEQLQEAFGWPNIAIGIALLVLGVFVRARSTVALGFAVAIMSLICVMLLLGLPRTLGGIPIAALFLYQMSKGFRAIDDLQQEERREASSSEGFETRSSEIPEGYKFSTSEAAQAIGVTRGTLQGYVKSGRINTNIDGSIDAAELLRAGFIIRTLPPRRG